MCIRDRITNADGDVTANYTIEKVDSTLTIKGNDPIDPGKETLSLIHIYR